MPKPKSKKTKAKPTVRKSRAKPKPKPVDGSEKFPSLDAEATFLDESYAARSYQPCGGGRRVFRRGSYGD